MKRIIEFKLIAWVFVFSVIFSVNAFAAISESAALDLSEFNKIRRLREDVRSTNTVYQSILRVHKPVKIVNFAILPKVQALPVLADFNGNVTTNLKAKPLDEISSQSNRMVQRTEKSTPRLQTFINSLFKGSAQPPKSEDSNAEVQE